MALYVRLASHVFNTFEAFKNWMLVQQIDIASNPSRAPILLAGQKVTISDTKTVYAAVQEITKVEDILEPDLNGGFLPKLLTGQSFLFPVFAPGIANLAIYPASTPGTVSLKLGEELMVHNAAITLSFDGQEENWNRTSSIHVLDEGNVSLNTGAFSVYVRTGTEVAKYREGKVVTLQKNSSYLLVLQNKTNVQLVETGKSTLPLSTVIPDNPNAALDTNIPSEKAVSTTIFNLNDRLSKAIKSSTGFLQYTGVDPSTDTVVKMADNELAVDIAYAAGSMEELPAPSIDNIYALTLNDNTTVNVLRSKTEVTPVFSVNPNYLGEGHFGTSGVSLAIITAYPGAVNNNVVSNLDTNSEWYYNGITWIETIRPAGDSKYLHNLNYKGVYDFRRTPSYIAKAIQMLFPLSVNGNIVNNAVTNTEWEKSAGVWVNSGRPVGATAQVNNPKVSGTFAWDPTNADQVKSVLIFRYGATHDDGKILLVQGGTEWKYDAYNVLNPWSDLGTPAGTHSDLPSPMYLGTGSFGVGAAAANSILLAHPEAVAGNYIGNTDTASDWSFDGTVWTDAGEAIGYYSKIPNPAYGGEYVFDAGNGAEVSAAISGTYPTAPVSNVVYSMMTNSEWMKSESGLWENTFSPNQTTPPKVDNPNILGSFNYLEYWAPPAETLKLVFPEAKYGYFVNNTSTGTEWEYSKDYLAWVDTLRPSGTTPTEGNDHYLGAAPYKTNPPTDTHILNMLFPNSAEGTFVHNITTDTYWYVLRGTWVSTKEKLLNRWMYDQVGVYSWEKRGTSVVLPGNLFHLTTRYIDTTKSEIYWFANSWNVLDFDSETATPFTTVKPGFLTGKKSFGFVEPYVDENDVTFGKVNGLVTSGSGNKYLDDTGNYNTVISPQVLASTDVYVDFVGGNDSQDGLTAMSAWKTLDRAKLFLATVNANYDSASGKSIYPAKVTLHLLGENATQDFTIENVSYLTVVGQPGSPVASCKKLSIINSSVTLQKIATKEVITTWKSKMQFIDGLSCGGLDIVESSVEQKSKLTIPQANSGYPAINIDERSLFYHGAAIETGVNLGASVPFINVQGTYVRGSNGSFVNLTNVLLRGVKASIGSLGRLIGADLNWFNNHVPYVTHADADSPDPLRLPTIRSMYGTDEKTGFQIADGRDLADVIGAGHTGITVKSTYLQALREIPIEERKQGMTVFIQQLKGLYYFRDGILDKDLVRMVIPHYNITYSVQECCADAWVDQFPYDLVDDENFLQENPVPEVEEPVEDYVFSSSLDWDELITAGKYYLQSVVNVSLHPPVNSTAWWWLEVGTHAYNGTELRIIQKAKQQDTLGYTLTRVFANGVWSNWSHNYAQFAG